MITSQHIETAARTSGATPDRVCEALAIAVPLLRELRATAAGWKFWLRWGMDVLIVALERYQAERCG